MNGPDMEQRLFDIDTLRRKQRRLQAPFGLRIAGTGIGEVLNCTAILRHLPGKRLVCRASRPSGEQVIIKLFLAPWHARRHQKRERDGIEALVSAQIPTPALFSPATLDDGRTPLVVTAAIPGARSLADFWPGLDARQRRTRLLDCIKLIACLHAAGYCQRDIHPGNFLVSAEDTLLIDGDAVRALRRRPFGTECPSLANLACFLVQFDPDADRLTAMALQAYAQHRRWPVRPQRLRDLKRLMRRYRHKRMQARAAKVTRTCTDVAVRGRWHRYIAYDRDWYSPAMQPLLDDPDQFIRQGFRLKDGNSATVARIRYQNQTLVIKRYNIKNIRHGLRRCLRPSRGRIAWRNAHMLRLIGIDTPRPLALIEECWGPFRSRAYLICAHQPGPHLADYWQSDWKADDARADALAPLTILFERLYAARISHGDMKATNIIVDDGKIVLMDLDGLRSYRFMPVFRRHYLKDCDRLLRNWQQHPNILRTLQQAITIPPMTGMDRIG